MTKELEMSALPKLAFLGPPGSHSYQCARNAFGSSAEYVERQTISDVFNAVSTDIPFAVIPQENSLYGSVTETYDLLRLPEVGEHKFVRGEVVLPIRHSLVARKGVKLENVHRVLSHEQALGQCARFLSEKLPEATRIKTPSTSAAAQALLSDSEEDRATESAAICSSLCVTVFDGLDILQDDIQDSNSNRTRFYILANSLETSLPPAFQPPPPRHALVRVSLKQPSDTSSEMSPKNRLIAIVLSTLYTTFGMPARRIDRRPSLSDVPFEDVYMIELEDTVSTTDESHDALRETMFARVRAGIQKVQDAGGEASLLGIW
ncbi:PDT-domain-containing protein [Laetiporus sulphureus 93-53]|uniref:PDT-domain-containing protein n=1 Tax=Laetiporus sulphureus 93-53 TaxID=1314785 RepID=A0A165DZL3_9APHY|nr:PDT-domain-containing protein [Laetiporus sulphureus 93-53]KZT05963.1 PDT-domain-containing protein [Laetiporus sulphureus 93-53]